MTRGAVAAVALATVGVGLGGVAVATSDSAATNRGSAAAKTPAVPLESLHSRPASFGRVWGVTRAPARHRVKPRPGDLPAAGILIDTSTGEVMWRRNSFQRRPIASLTKMMNALVVVDLASPSKRVRVSPRAAAMGGSVVGGLPAGGTMRVGSLLRGMLIVSGNDAANALADALGPGRRRFVRRMNAKARAMKLGCTRFTTPEGLDEGNRSCAHDLAVIARAVLANPALRSTVGKRWDRITRGSNGSISLRNRNPLLQRGWPGLTGVKTGHTGPAGWCLVASATRGGHSLISVMLGEDERAWQTQRLLAAGFAALNR